MAFPVVAVVRPSDLISASNGNLSPDVLTNVHFPGRGTGQLHRSTARAWAAMTAECKAATGVTLTVTSIADAYRTYQQQKSAFLTRMEPVSYATYLLTSRDRRRTWVYNGQKYWRRRAGFAAVATPGTSNHGWALALDVAELRANGTLLGISASTAWAWLLANAGRFGFSWELQSEPWHLRYYKGDTTPEPLPPPNQPVWPPFDPAKGLWGLWPLNTSKPRIALTVPYTQSDAVRYLQGVILFKGGGRITVDGVYGPGTAGRVRDVQGFFGGPGAQDDVVGQTTWGYIDLMAGL